MSNLAHYKRHLIRNRKWLWKSLETFGLGVFVINSGNYFDYPHHTMPFMVFLSNPLMIGALFAVATFTLVVVMWNLHYLWARQIMGGSQFMVWLWFAWGFLQRDIDMQMIGSLNTWTAFICVCILGQILSDAIWDGDNN
jgi:hypothetical protein